MSDIQKEYESNLRLAREVYEKTSAQYNGNTSFHTRMRMSAYMAIQKVHADYQRKLKGHSKIVPLLKKAGLPIASSRTTAIRGHKDYSLGFKVSSDADGVRIYFQDEGYETLGTRRGLTLQQKSQAIDVLLAAGYELDVSPNKFEIISYNPPS